MPIRLSPAIKGLITSLLMIALIVFIDAKKDAINTQWQYLVYILYAAGIAWTIIAVRRDPAFSGKFGDLFSQGFKCFIIVSLMLVAFTIIFIKTHPELAVQEAKNTREYYLAQKDKTPPQIEELAQKAKKQYAVTVISISIFRYLIIGAVFTGAISALLTRRL